MSEQTHRQTTPKRGRITLRQILAALLLITLALGALVYWRPVATINAVQSGLLRLSGIKSQYAQVGPYRVHYLLGGEGPPLLLLHGHPSRALEWGSLLPELTRAHRVIAIDFLGYGESDAPDVDYSVATQTEVVTGLLDALQLAQADVLGFSWVAG